jgi:hypothetical protein
MSTGPNLASLLVAASAAIMFTLGALHLVLTFFSARFHPRDTSLEARLKQVSPRISAGTTLWRAGTGFHASHSLGVMGFGLVFAHLAWFDAAALWRSAFLPALGAAALLAWLVLAWRYWFRVPLIGIAVAATLYGAALVSHAA